METKKIIPNKKQEECIQNIKGKYLVLAGPGTGKTFTLINRIENMLKNKTAPEKILCLTYSDAAASEMKTRLIKKLGVIASSVDIFTYHSFCNNIIKLYPEEFDLGANFKIITQVEKTAIMKECIDCAKIEYFIAPRADKYYYTNDFISISEKLKSLRIKKDEYLSYIDKNPELAPKYKEIESQIYENEKKGNTRNTTRYKELEKIKTKIEKAKEVWNLKELYCEKMYNKNLIDFSDMINFVIQKFESDNDFLRKISNKYEYFLVDEYQDTNLLQNSIIFNLIDSNENKNIFVVGDDDQIIYGFQGAKIDTVEKFLDKYKDTKVICLEENNRSTKSILDFSYEVIKQDELRLENNPKFKNLNITKKLLSKNPNIEKKDKKVEFIEFSNTLEENNHIIDRIINLINSPECPKDEKNEKDLSQIAVITKKNSDLCEFYELLRARNIECQIENSKSIFSIRSSIAVYFYLKALNNHILSADKLFSLLIMEPFKINLEDYNKILYQKRILGKKSGNDFISIMESIKKWNDEEKIKNFLNTFYYLKKYISANSLRDIIIETINRTGILEYFLKCDENKIENIEAIKKIISQAQEFQNSNITASLADFINYLDDCIKNEIDIKLDKNKTVRNAIQLTTFHSSKGREFEYVFLPDLISKKWEDFRNPREYKLICEEIFEGDFLEKKKNSELLKLLFVGITRAKHSLLLSFSDENEGNSQQITKYLKDFSNYDFNRKQFNSTAQENEAGFIKSISREVFDNQKALQNEIKQRTKEIILSASRLNDYISCPRKFFYLKVLGIDIEEADWDSANFGTIIHNILENAMKYAKSKEEYPKIEKVKEEFQKAMDKTAFFNEASREKFIKRAQAIFENYYPKFIQIPPSRIYDAEFCFDNVKINGNFITGKIDRIEQNKDGLFELYDYKTGVAPSQNQICSNGTKEDYFNQLCFYKLAFEKMTGKKVSKTGLIYVEQGKIIEISPNENDTGRIEKLIEETYKNIKNLEFMPSYKKNACQFCTYKNMCKLDLV